VESADATRAEGDSPTQPKAERVPPPVVRKRGMADLHTRGYTRP